MVPVLLWSKIGVLNFLGARREESRKIFKEDERMLKRTWFLSFIMMTGLFIVTIGCGNTAADTVKNPEAPENSGLDLVYKAPGMEQVDIKRDIVYKADKDMDLKMDIYYPLGEKPSSTGHTVILVHGSGPVNSFKDTEVYKSWGKAIAANGLTAVTFNWRPSVSTDDVKDLIRYVRDNAGDLKINGDSITIFAFSAGANEGVKEAALINTGFLKSIVVYYGKLDNSILSTVTNSKLPPIFIAMGALDSTIPAGSNDKFISEARDMGCEIISVVHSKGIHGFDVFNNDEESYDIIEKTIKFIKDSSRR